MLNEICPWSFAFLALQLVGLLSVLLARLPIPHRAGWGAFFACLIVIGSLTCISLTQGSSCWVPCGTTFSMMIVGAIFHSPTTTLHAL